MTDNANKLHSEAQEFAQKMEDTDYKKLWEEFPKLSNDMQDMVQAIMYRKGRVKIDKYFVPENADKEHEEHISPNGQYRLVITNYSTEKGSWSYTQGLVYRKGEEKPMFEIRRNYSDMPFAWIENHKSGHQFLITGEDYQGQTVLELDTGKRRDYIPREEALGHGFCWTRYRLDPVSSILTVDGCVWACPYEFKFYDFLDPMGAGWPEIEIV